MSQVRTDRLFASGLMAFVVFLALCALVFCFAFSVRAIQHTKNDFKVDEKLFLSAVNLAVSNYLANISGAVIDSPAEETTVAGEPSVSFVGVPGLGTSCFPSGRWVCVLDGVQYSVGDFCPYGLIRRISSGRVYVSDSGGFSVLRPALRADPPLRKNAQADSAQPDEG